MTDILTDLDPDWVRGAVKQFALSARDPSLETASLGSTLVLCAGAAALLSDHMQRHGLAQFRMQMFGLSIAQRSVGDHALEAALLPPGSPRERARPMDPRLAAALRDLSDATIGVLLQGATARLGERFQGADSGHRLERAFFISLVNLIADRQNRGALPVPWSVRLDPPIFRGRDPDTNDLGLRVRPLSPAEIEAEKRERRSGAWIEAADGGEPVLRQRILDPLKPDVLH